MLSVGVCDKYKLLSTAQWKGDDFTQSKINIAGCFLFQVRSEIITTYALCGFANFSSLGIVIGGLCEYFNHRAKNINK